MAISGSRTPRAGVPGRHAADGAAGPILIPASHWAAGQVLGQSAPSQQLALLRRRGIVTSRRDGKKVRYRGDSVARILGDLQNYLKFCC
jgi:hypothetical protein